MEYTGFMHDIRLALGLIGFLSVAVFLGGRRIARLLPPRALDAAAVALLLLMAAYLKYVWGQLWIVQWISLPSVIVLSNWFPLLLAALAAVVWQRLGGDPAEASSSESPNEDVSQKPASSLHSKSGLAIRRTVMMAALTAGAVWSVMYFIPSTPPECGDHWEPPYPPFPWPVCRQTNNSTCSAASSATILVALGIPATEQEMAQLCLTRNGTTWLGLYHGLTTKLLGTKYRVRFFESEIDALPELGAQHPLLLCCKLDAAAAEQLPEYERDGGWIRGTAHSVVYFGQFNGSHIIGDPSRGYEAWSDKDMEILWTGQGLRITDQQQPVALLPDRDNIN
jgi:hypothetical protein